MSDTGDEGIRAENAAPAHGLTPVDIPYAFARKHGVVIVAGRDGDAPLKVALREGGDPRVLVEVRRHLARSFDVALVDAKPFEKHLSDHYAMEGSAAAMAGSLPRRWAVALRIAFPLSDRDRRRADSERNDEDRPGQAPDPRRRGPAPG